MENEWKLVGFDAFEEEYYSLNDSYPNENEARQAAILKFKEINKLQPPEEAGGQDDEGIQDRLFIERPNGSKYRFIPLPEELAW